MQHELEIAIDLAHRAGEEILSHFRQGIVVEQKGGEGPVTLADRRADAIIRRGIAAAFPADGLLSEETPDDASRLKRRRVWLVDPLDGTRQFVANLPEFAVMIGLAVDGDARLGVVHLPCEGRSLIGVVGEGAWQVDSAGRRQPCQLEPVAPGTMLRAAVSRLGDESRTRRVVALLGATALPSGSVGRKAALVAAGEADLYLTLSGRSQHWDACAADAIVRAAGGFFGTASGATIRYNTAEIRNTQGLMACRPGLQTRLVSAVENTPHLAGR